MKSQGLKPSKLQLAGFLAVLLALASLPLWAGGYLWSLGSLTLMWIGLTLSWNLISGYTGYVSLGHTAFFGMGAYVGALLTTDLGVAWPVAAIIAGLAMAGIAAPIGYSLLRLRGPFFAVGMLGLSEVFRIAVNQFDQVTGGGAGLYLTPPPYIWPIYFGFLATTSAVFLVTWVVNALPYGRTLLAIRDDEEAAEVLGRRTTNHKVSAFIISAFFPGVLGTNYAIFISYLDPISAFTIEYNLIIVLMGALGGPGTLMGPVIGATAIGLLREMFWISFPQLHLVIFGIVMVVTVLLLPRGVYPEAVALVRRLKGKAAAGADRTTAPPAGTGSTKWQLATQPQVTPGNGALLALESVDKRFGARKVVDGCTFEISAQSITGLIGPNGSGKTTTLNLVSGLLTPENGTIRLDGQRIEGRSPHSIAARGIGRTFQIPRLFDRLPVLDNMMVASPQGLSPTAARRHAASGLALVGLTGLEDRPASMLSYGQRKLLEIARVLMASPSLILMDEPFAGVNPILRERIAELIKALSAQGYTFVVIGHEMTEMMALCQRMLVMDQGTVIAEGTPESVQADQRVFEAYFGRSAQFTQGDRS